MLWIPSSVLIALGIFFWIFPMNYPNTGYRPPNDPSRYISHHGISLGMFADYSKEQWVYVQKTWPKVLLAAGILSGCAAALIGFLFPAWDKSLVTIINTVVFLLLPYLYVERKVDKIKTGKK